ncbi:SDR family NAD(P)-dependent oxidoreductase [Amycolatopsis orientalis]|uniref:SDR family NAD(P)-dependent oxidoreductase n=1 Tax=Amycolatopsis orientalis TaxID=31958 RepID=UPI00039D1B94|nr:SDR family NAD(P)-dependent oxidoreductase [Amycolatopsis orientalis]
MTAVDSAPAHSLTGLTAVVTGGRQGIGAAIARALLRHGARVFVCGRSCEGVAAAVDALHHEGLTGARGFAGDLSEAGARHELLRDCGRADILVNNAGGFLEPTRTLDTTRAEWEEQLRLNLTLPFLLCRDFLPPMIDNGWGRIVNIGTVAATAPQLGNSAAYVAAKSGLVGFTRQLAAEVAHHGVTANVLNPGTIRTEHLADYLESSGQREEDLAARIPVGRLGRAAEIGDLVPALVSRSAGFLTGAVIDVNGAAVSS